MDISHPSQLITAFYQARPQLVSIALSRYTYYEGLDRADREITHYHPSQIATGEWRKIPLGQGQDIAFHSLVEYFGDGGLVQRHIPLIDFQTSKLDKMIKVMDDMTADLGCQAWVYSSGRSFHAYFDTLLSHAAWIQFMGRLLSRHDKAVDIRWVGFRLIEGFASLRWTMHSDRHSMEPELIGGFGSRYVGVAQLAEARS